MCYTYDVVRFSVPSNLYESNKQEAALNEQMVRPDGLSQVLRHIAGRMEGNVDGLNKELLLQSADQLDKLATVADTAEMIIDKIPGGKRGRIRVAAKVTVADLMDLAAALDAAGRNVRRSNV